MLFINRIINYLKLLIIEIILIKIIPFQALVGIAFSVGFVLGPMIGAIFAKFSIREGQWYAVPAMFAFFLSICDLFYVTMNMKESLAIQNRAQSLAHGISGALTYINPKDLFQFDGVSGLTRSGITVFNVFITQPLPKKITGLIILIIF